MAELKCALYLVLLSMYCDALAVESRSDVLPEPGVCGVSADDRLIGGIATHLDEFPWMAIMKYYNPERNRSILMCGGSLINPQYVVTAAHCVEKSDLAGWNLTHVRLGEWRISTNPDCDESEECADPVKDYEVENVIIHEKYVPQQQQHHDIALIRLSEKVKYSYFVQPICLPIHPELRTFNYVGKVLKVSGWGTTETSAQSDIKLKVDLPGVALDVCNAAFKNEKNITENQLCAGAELNKDSCTGDSGGPLMGLHKLNGQSLYYQYIVGIVSYGFRVCGKEGKPGVYIRTSSYVDWILSNLKQ